MKKSTGNRLGAALVLGGAAAGAGVGAMVNKGCTRGDSAYSGTVRGMEVAGLVGGLVAVGAAVEEMVPAVVDFGKLDYGFWTNQACAHLFRGYTIQWKADHGLAKEKAA